eukprot:6460203-Amphidinium_carterae.4
MEGGGGGNDLGPHDPKLKEEKANDGLAGLGPHDPKYVEDPSGRTPDAATRGTTRLQGDSPVRTGDSPLEGGTPEVQGSTPANTGQHARKHRAARPQVQGSTPKGDSP